MTNLLLKVIDHLFIVIGSAVARRRSSISRRSRGGEARSKKVKLRPVAEYEIGKTQQDGEDDRAPEEVDVSVDGEGGVVVDQPPGALHLLHEVLVAEQLFQSHDDTGRVSHGVVGSGGVDGGRRSERLITRRGYVRRGGREGGEVRDGLTPRSCVEPRCTLDSIQI